MDRIANRPGCEGAEGLRSQALAWIRNQFEQNLNTQTAVEPHADRADRRTHAVQIVRTNKYVSSQLQGFTVRPGCARQYLVDPECTAVLTIVY